MRPDRLLIVFTFALAFVVGTAAALALESWWVLPLALLAHGAGTLLVTRVAFKHAGDERDKPDPVTEARQEEHRLAS